MSWLASGRPLSSAGAQRNAHVAPGREQGARLVQIGRAEIQRGDRQARVVVLDEGQEASGAAGQVQELGFGAAPPGHEGGERHQSLAAHGIGRAGEEHLDLVVVELGRASAQVAVGLIVEILQIVGRKVLLESLVRPDLGAGAGVAPPLDTLEIGEVGRRHGKRLERRGDQIVGHPVVTGLDVAPVLSEQLDHVPAQARRLRERAGDLALGLDRLGQPSGQPGLAHVEPDPAALADQVGGAIETRRHLAACPPVACGAWTTRCRPAS